MKQHMRLLALLLALVMLTACLSACGKKAEAPAAAGAAAEPAEAASGDTQEPAKAGSRPNKLVIMNSKQYVSDFPFAAGEFGEKYNCDVEHVYGGGSMGEYLMSILSGGLGKVDVVNINPIYVQQFLNEGLLQEIDISRVKSYEDIMPMFRDHKAFRDADGNIYAVPWVWGSTSLAYNSEVIDEEITSWKQMWSGDYAGQIAYFDDYFSAIVTAALYLGEDPSNPDMAKVEAALLDMQEQAKTYWSSYDDWMKAFKSREITIGNVWTGAVTNLQQQGEPIVYVYPEEGAIGWADSWVILKDAPNYDMAVEWINYATSEYFQNCMATYSEQRNTPTNTKVLDALSDADKQALLIFPAIPDNLFLQYQTAEQETEWVAFWDRIKATQ